MTLSGHAHAYHQYGFPSTYAVDARFIKYKKKPLDSAYKAD